MSGTSGGRRVRLSPGRPYPMGRTTVTQHVQVSGSSATELPTPARSIAGDTVAMRPPADVTRHQRDVALTWARRGVLVVPCNRTDKGALVPGFGRDATGEQLRPFGDPDTVAGWWSGQYRRAHVGLLCGRGPGRGLVVIDLDMPKDGAALLEGRWAGCYGGADVLELLMRQAGAEWPETYTVGTPSGGTHLYFFQPEDGPLIGCATGDGTTAPHLGPMVDVRGVGGYVIAAGSYSATQGRAYRRVSPPEIDPQPLPGWLLELLRPAAPPRREVRPPATVLAMPTGDRAERYAAAALRGAADRVAAAGDGEYWKTVSGAALRLAELSATAPRVLTEQTVTDVLAAAATRAGMEERAALRAIRTAWKSKSRTGMVGGAA